MRHFRLSLLLTVCALTALASPVLAQDGPSPVIPVEPAVA